MSELGGPGKILIILGVLLLAIGVLLLLGIKAPWLGRLPRDIVIKKGNFTFYFPIVTCILLSIILSVVFWIFRK
jgi:uncharacterized protein YybS (DUF2232 family)